MRFEGEKASEVLAGLLTSDVAALGDGRWQRGAALTPKGRVIALVRVIKAETGLLVDGDAAAAPGFVGMIRKYVNPRLSRYTDLSESTTCIGVYGQHSARHLANALAIDEEKLANLADNDVLSAGQGESAVTVVRSTDFGARIPGFDCIASVETGSQLLNKLHSEGLPVASAEAIAIARIEAGMPEWGTEMNDETIPQEANLDQLGAISFNKGCYTGQEVVARIHFRGHVNRHLRRLTTPVPVAVGATVHDSAGKEVGDVRSAVVSPRLGSLSVAMVRREVEPGSEVTVRSGDIDIAAQCEEMTEV